MSSAWHKNSPNVIESLSNALSSSFFVASLTALVGTFKLIMYGTTIGYSLHKYVIILNKNSNLALVVFWVIWSYLISSTI